MKYLLLIILYLYSINVFSQTYPNTFDLSVGDYSFEYWGAESPAGTYPPNMMLHTYAKADPLISDKPNGDWALAYNLTAKSRIMGGDENGIIFYNTSTSNEGAGFAGEAVIALNTLNCKDIILKYTVRLILSGQRAYGLKLQYRIGSSGEFIDFPDADFRSNDNLDSAVYDLVLPKELENLERIELCWKYYYLNITNAGARPQIALDDIYITNQKSSVEDEKSNTYIANNILRLDENQDYNSIEIYNINGHLLGKIDAANKQNIDLNPYNYGNVIYIKIKGGKKDKIILHNFRFSSN